MLGVACLTVLIIPSVTFGQSEGRCTVNGQEIPCPEAVQAIGKAAIGFGIFALVMGTVGIAATVFWIMMLVHAASKPIENKALWIVLMVITGIIGAIVYYFAVKRTFISPAATSVIPQVPHA